MSRVRQSRTFARILLFVAFGTVLLILILSGVLLRTSVSNGLSITETFNDRLLSEITYSLEFTNAIVEGFAVELFLDPANEVLLYNPNPSEFEIQRIINQLYRKVVSNPAVFSVGLYNRQASRLYSVVETGADTDDLFVREAFLSGELPTPLRPVPRLYEPDVVSLSIPVITYFLYEPSAKQDGPLAGIAVNATVQWLESNLDRFRSNGARLAIIDGDGNLVASGSGADAIDEPTLARYMAFLGMDDSIPKTRSETDVFTGGSTRIVSVGGERRVVAAEAIPGTSWFLVNDQSYRVLFEKTERMRRTILWIAAGFLVLAAFVSLVISRQIYEPIGRLVRRVRQTDIDRSLPANLDDAEYLSRAFERQQVNLEQLAENQRESARLSRELLIKRVVLEGTRDDDEADIAPVRLIGLRWSISEREQLVATERLAETLVEVVSQSLADTHEVRLVTQQVDLVVCLVTRKSDRQLSCDRYQAVAAAARRTAADKHSVHLAVFVTDESNSPRGLHESFLELQAMQTLSVMRGPNTTAFVSERPMRPDSAVIERRDVLADRILIELKEQSPEEAAQLLDQYLDCISNATVAFFTFSLIELAIAINGFLSRLSGSTGVATPPFAPVEYEVVIHPSSREAIRNEFLRVFGHIEDRLRSAALDRASAISESIVGFIQDNYPDPALCLKSIAADFKMSPSHLGHLFKQHQGSSVAEYINGVRLGQVAHMLADTRLSIREIMESVGFVNESSFYKRFKQHHGVTPARYRTSLSIEHLAARGRTPGDPGK